MLAVQTTPGEMRSWEALMPEMCFVWGKVLLRQAFDQMEKDPTDNTKPDHVPVPIDEPQYAVKREYLGRWRPQGP